MGIRLSTGRENKNLSILNTYSANMVYQTEQVVTQWDTLNQYLNTIPKTYIRIWRTGNNGQTAPSKQDTNNNFGQWILTNKSEKSNG